MQQDRNPPRLLREKIKNLHLLGVTTIKGSVVKWDQEEKNQKGLISDVVGDKTG